MKSLNKLSLSGVAVVFALGLSACDKQPGPAESAGKKIDQTAESAGKKIEQTAESASKKIEATAEKMGDKMSEQSAKAGTAISDTEITAKVKASIFAEPGLKTLQIGVDTVKGVVTLTGSVNTESDSNSARALAGAVSGVQKVENLLDIKPRKRD